MRKNIGVHTFLYPQPVLMIATFDKDGNPDCMNAAWGGISDTNKITIAISASHKTTKNILKTKAFTISPATKKYVKECDYLGIASGNDIKDKLKACGLHATKSELVNAPIIEEFPLTLICKLVSYDTTNEILVGEIIDISVDEAILTNNKIDVDKLEPISFDPVNNAYLLVKEKVGNAFKDGLMFKK